MMTNKFIKYFLQGLILCIPLGLTIIVFVQIFNFFGNLFLFFAFTDSNFLNSLISISIFLAFVTLLGVLASSYLFQKLFEVLELKLENAPLIRHIYSPIKDFMNAFVGNKKKFTKPVLVLTNPQANIQEIGFITQDDLSELKIKDRCAVYLPYSYSFSGRMVVVPKEQITFLEIDGSDAMKFIISGGVTEVD